MCRVASQTVFKQRGASRTVFKQRGAPEQSLMRRYASQTVFNEAVCLPCVCTPYCTLPYVPVLHPAVWCQRLVIAPLPAPGYGVIASLWPSSLLLFGCHRLVVSPTNGPGRLRYTHLGTLAPRTVLLYASRHPVCRCPSWSPGYRSACYRPACVPRCAVFHHFWRSSCPAFGVKSRK